MAVIAIVTGASSGLGREFVKQMDEQEILDEIWVIARRRERLEELQKTIKTPLRILSYDLTKSEHIEELTALLEEEKPLIKILINAAGLGKIGSYADIPLAQIDNMINLNCRAAVDVTQISIPYMKHGSRIMEICSTAAFQPFQYLNVYAATKSFLYRYSRALRMELLHTGIIVTAVCPYWIKDTEFIGTAQKNGNASYIKGFPFSSKQTDVVRLALLDSRYGLAVSTPGVMCTIHRAVAKIVPATVMMAGWEFLRQCKE